MTLSFGQSTERETQLASAVETYKQMLVQQQSEHAAALNNEKRKIQAAEFKGKDAERLLDYYTSLYAFEAVPSILAQTHYPCGLFQFPHQEGTYYFNPSCVKFDGKRWLVTRRLCIQADMKNVNSIVLWEIGADNSVSNPLPAGLPVQDANDNYEDPRAFTVGEKMWLGCCHYRSDRQIATQSVTELTTFFQSFNTWHPQIGNNRVSIVEQVGHEKNWAWFDYEGIPHCVYIPAPEHYVFRFQSGGITGQWKTSKTNPLWRHGTPRGGSPPVRIGDEYFAFFHSSTPWRRRQRRYHMGAYAFKAEPPFEVTRMSCVPILSGSEADPIRHMSPPVVFPCGVILQGGSFYVTLGINDCASAWILIPLDDILRTMKEL